MTSHISDHGEERARERANLSRGSTEKMARRALQKGFHYYESTGPLRRYLETKTTNTCQPLVHGEFIYLFSKDQSPVLITVLNLPNEHKKQAHKIRKRLNL